MHDGLDLHVGAAAVGRSQHPDRGQFISRIHQGAPHQTAIDHLLPFIKMFLSVGQARQMVSPKGFQADSQVAERPEQDRHVARLDGHRTSTHDQGFFFQNVIPQPARQGIRLRPAGRLRVCVFLRQGDEAEFHPFVRQGQRIRRHGQERFVQRLQPFDGSGRKHIRATAVHGVKQLGVGPKISLQSIPLTFGCRRQDVVADNGIVGFNIRPPKRINGLLGIAHDKQFARRRLHAMPFPGFGARGLGQKQDDLVLDRVGILKFIDDNRLVLLFQFGAHVRVVPQQAPRPREQSVKRHQPLFHKGGPAMSHKRGQELHRVP